MAEKKISLEALEEVLALTNEYHERYAEGEYVWRPILEKRTKASRRVAGEDNWLNVHNIVDGARGFNNGVSAGDIAKFLEVLGWTVE